jgi:hypothetical protein
LPQTQYIKPRTQIRNYNAYNVFQSLNSHDLELTLDDLVEIGKQSALEEPKPESRERIMTVPMLTEGLGLIDVARYLRKLFRTGSDQ